MSATQDTRESVLESGLALASQVGLGGITIGRLAEAVDLTKAGLYAHFDSKEEILREILETAVERFIEQGVRPALEAPRGEPRVRALFEAWLEWSKAPPLPGGCVFISSATELDDRPGPLREYLVRTQNEWREMLERSVREAQEEEDFRADVEPKQFVFEVFSVILSFHYYDRLFEDPDAEGRTREGFQRLVERARSSGACPPQ